MTAEAVEIRDEHAGTRAKIAVAVGFNCFSFEARAAGQPFEVLWSAPGFSEGIGRPSHSGIPILFPFAGRLHKNEIQFGGSPYTVGDLDDPAGNAIHGYALNRSWTVVEQTPSRLAGELHAASQAPALRKKWPADFRLRVAYELLGNKLTCEISVSNPDQVPLPFGLGLHPYFRLPLGPGGSADRCRIEVPVREYWVLDDLLPTGERRPAEGKLNLAQGLNFGETALDHVFTGLTPPGGPHRATIHDPANGRTLALTFDGFFKNCVVFNPPHRQAICIEPYSCVPDAYSLIQRGVDPGLSVLAPGASMRTAFAVELTS